jgi:hypothetical protein
VIKQYVDQDLQDKLFEHTRMLRERRMTTEPVEKDQMFLVRKKSRNPGRKIDF